MILTYEALDAQGKKSRDTVEAIDSREAVDKLRRRGLFVTDIHESSDTYRTQTSKIFTTIDPYRLPLKALVLFTRQMAMLLRAGSGVVPSIAAIRRQMKKTSHTMLLGEMIKHLEEGSRFSDALRKFPQTFDPVYCAIVSAGDASATMPEMFDRLAGIVSRRRLLRNNLIGAMIYPLLLLKMSFGILMVLLLFVVPRFQDMFITLSVEPPMSTQVLLAVGAAFRDHWPFLVLGAAMFVGGAMTAMFTVRGKQWLSDIQLSIPIVGTIRSQLLQAQVFRTMGMLLDSGVGVLEAIGLVRTATRNRRFQKLFHDLEQSISSGGNLSGTFERSGLIDSHVCQAVYTGEESGQMGGSLIYCADTMDEANMETINTALKLLEPMILIIMGFVVGTVAVSLFIPLFDLTSAMR